jgi:hypothetical protein
MSNYSPRHKPISSAHSKCPKIPQAHKLPVPSEADVKEEEAYNHISAPIDTCKSTNKFLRLRVCRNGVLEGLESCFRAREEIDAEEGGDERDDVRRTVEIEEGHDEMLDQ